MKKRVFLGIDTSNYRTSICLIDEERKVIFEERQLLNVKEGDRGLQQSNALFQHVKNLPNLFKGLNELNDYMIEAIAVSKKPRPNEGSYMPVFLAGVSVAESMASTFSLPCYYTSHQEGHIAAGIYSSERILTATKFLTIHLSGGTSELLNISSELNGYVIEKLGGTLDLHAGQLIDRIGVLLGFSFPSGEFFEKLALNSSEDFKRIPSSIRDYSFHFSGAETEAIKRVKANEKPEEIARAIEHIIAVSIQKVLKKAIEQGFPRDVLVVGGVAQNQYIRNYLIKKLEHKSVQANLFFATKHYSGDNAYGVANIALNQFFEKK